MEQTAQFCTFHVGGLLFGIELRHVQEVVRYGEMTPVPLAPLVVSGLINLRGQIVTAIDLRRRLQITSANAAGQPMNVVVNAAGGPISLLVDEIGDVVEVREDTFEPPPETLRGPLRGVISGVHKLNERLLHVLDTKSACEVA
jgi:purine-binding chemotaxis protein CheW